jgi:hypothetical protein
VVVSPVLAPRPLGVAPLAAPHPLSPAPAPLLVTAPPPVRFPGIVSRKPAGSPAGPLACDPMSAMLSTGAVCIGPYIFSLEIAGSPSFTWTPPPFLAAATYGAFGSLWPSLTVPLCPLCTGPVSGPAGPAIPVDPVLLRKFLSPIETSRLISRGILPGLAPFQGISRFEPPPAPPSPATIVRPSRSPVFFLLRDGTTDIVARYRLGEDWLLHYVTVSGQQKTLSIQQLDLDATASANFARGVPFSLPGWPAPAPRH